MPRLPRVSGKDVLAALRRAGFRDIRVTGSHHHLRHPERGGLVTIPVHGTEILAPKTLRTILDQAGMEPAELETHL